MGKIKNILIYFISPLIIVTAAFIYSPLVGFFALIGFLSIIYYQLLPQIYRMRGSKSYNEDNLEEAIKWFDKAQKTGRGGTGTSVSLAYLMLKKGDVEGSESLFKRTYERNDTTEEFRKIIKSNIALIKWKKGKLDEAIETLEELMANFKTTNIYGSLGYLYIAKGDYEKALEFNLEALDYNNSNSIILDNLGETYFWMNKLEEAESTYKKLVALNPKFPEAYYHYGCVLEKLGKSEEAKQNFIKAATFKTNFLSTVSKEQIDEKNNFYNKTEENIR